VLQLALAIDYAIILCDRYMEEHETMDSIPAVKVALSKAIPEISSSSLTTVCGMAAMMFMRSMAKLTIWVDQLKVHTTMREQVPEGWNIYKINGPLFFAAADRVFNDMIVSLNSTKGLILDVSSVNVLDAGGLSSFQHFAEDLRKAGVKLLVCELQYQPLKTLVRAKFEPVSGVVELSRTVEDAIERSHQM
jgi:SulP family sulfate permease